MEMEELKKVVVHTEDDIDNMPDDEYCITEERVSRLMEEFGFKGCWEFLTAEKQLIKLRELLENPSIELGCKFDNFKDFQKKHLLKIKKENSTEKSICKGLKSLIGNGMLELSNIITYNIDDDYETSFKYLYNSDFCDAYDECENENLLTANPSYIEDSDDYIKVDKLPLDILKQIVADINDGNAILYSEVEYIAKIRRLLN